MAEFMRGMILPTEGGGPVFFQWNPEKIGGPIAKAGWDVIKTAGREQPYLEYSCAESTVYKFTIQLSRMDNPDEFVSETIKRLVGLTKPIMAGGKVKRPPRVMFMLGSFLRKTCVVLDVDPISKGIFHPHSLLPFDAEVAITLAEYLE
jgi:hypothetical protein